MSGSLSLKVCHVKDHSLAGFYVLSICLLKHYLLVHQPKELHLKQKKRCLESFLCRQTLQAILNYLLSCKYSLKQITLFIYILHTTGLCPLILSYRDRMNLIFKMFFNFLKFLVRVRFFFQEFFVQSFCRYKLL